MKMCVHSITAFMTTVASGGALCQTEWWRLSSYPSLHLFLSDVSCISQSASAFQNFTLNNEIFTETISFVDRADNYSAARMHASRFQVIFLLYSKDLCLRQKR